MGAVAVAGPSGSSLPAWCPAWAERIGDAYLSGTSCLFLLHGNVRDVVPLGPSDTSAAAASVMGTAQWGTVPEFLSRELFGRWDIVLAYDIGKGLRPLAGPDPSRLRTMVQWLTERLGVAATWPRDPDAAITALDALLERNLIDPPDQRKRIAVVLDYAQYLAPAGDAAASVRAGAGRLVRLLSWATNPLLRRVNVAIVLLTDSMAEMHPGLVTHPAVTAIDVPLPNALERERFALATAVGAGVPSDQTAAVQRVAAISGGLSLESLRAVITMSARDGSSPDGPEFALKKKELIERSCQGLVEFIQPRLTLDAVAGHVEAKQRLLADAKAINRGQLESAPMGYLICGPVGTGKSFIAECYAGSVGIPCAMLKNFRSKYVGETEGNLEHALDVLRSLGPVVVVIDEADAALGNRQSNGDSGTSARVFSMIARQMGDTRYRGKIVWMLLTSRPDLLPIDLKRQGRAEVHIPLFYPHDQAEMESMFTAMARKCESISESDFRASLDDFMPSAQGLEKELQEIAAVLECTEKRFLPERWKEKVSQPGGRSHLQERLAAIREIIGS
ncbi:MAG: AAA family ATPase [Planctomycetia bacterium]|nr:AAA family ATPase [Planctomycetia bacterium]